MVKFRKDENNKKICIMLIACFTAVLIGCSAVSNTSDVSDNAESIPDEDEINSLNLEEYNRIAEKNNTESDVMTLAINVDDAGNVLDSADVRIISAIYETEKVEHFDDFDEHWHTIPHYDRYFSEDGTLLPEYVFAEITVEISSTKSWDELLLTGFELKYISDGESGTREPQIIDKCLDYNNPHKGTAISIEANTPKLVTLGYPIYRESFESITEAYLYGRFAQFNIMDNADGSLPVAFSNME
ncbi:MAG: hypothetical protein K2I00_10925 [Ruminococcus sp.]|nr:hypothetical protein [Ruminococcus sp.]